MAAHVQLLKICAHLFRICNVCYFYYLSPVYCVHVRIVVLYLLLSIMVINKSVGPTGCCRVLDDPSRWFSVKSSKLSRCFSRAQLSVGSPSSTPGCPSSPLDPSRSLWGPAP